MKLPMQKRLLPITLLLSLAFYSIPSHGADPKALPDSVVVIGGKRFVLPYKTGMTLTAALTAAYGITDFSNFGTGLVRSGKNTKVDVGALIKKKAADVVLKPWDIIVDVDTKTHPDYVVVIGSKVSSQPLLVPYEKDLTLGAAIAASGGIDEFSNVGAYLVHSGKCTWMSLRAIVKGRAPDVLLKPWDIVIIRQWGDPVWETEPGKQGLK